MTIDNHAADRRSGGSPVRCRVVGRRRRWLAGAANHHHQPLPAQSTTTGTTTAPPTPPAPPTTTGGGGRVVGRRRRSSRRGPADPLPAADQAGEAGGTGPAPFLVGDHDLVAG